MIHESGGSFAGFNTPSVLQTPHWNPHLVSAASLPGGQSHLNR